MMRRRFIEVAAWSALLFVALPLIVKALRGTFTEGVLMGTGAAIVWYTLETLALRKETASLREETAHQRAVAVKQNEIGIEQNRIALRQAETAICPLLVSRIEELDTPMRGWFPRLVVRNIGHGPALFAQVQVFTVSVRTYGD